MEQLEEDEHETTHNNSQTNGQGPHTNNSKGSNNPYNCIFSSVSSTSIIVFLYLSAKLKIIRYLLRFTQSSFADLLHIIFLIIII